MGFEGYGEMRFRLHKTLYEELGVTLQAEDFKLEDVHQGVEQGTFSELFVEDDDIEKGEGLHVGDFGKIVESEGAGLSVERRLGNALAVEFDNANLIEQSGRKIGPHSSLVLVAERLGSGEIKLSLFQQVGGDIVDSLGKLDAG